MLSRKSLTPEELPYHGFAGSNVAVTLNPYAAVGLISALGNLFFDQAFFLPETAEAFIDRHIFYDGRYLNTELLTIRFTNNALSHYMEPADRAQLLNRIFKISEVEGLSE